MCRRGCEWVHGCITCNTSMQATFALSQSMCASILQARLRVGARLQHLQTERSTLVSRLQALSDPQDVEMYEQVSGSFMQTTMPKRTCAK